jgi:hypothetical protein
MILHDGDTVFLAFATFNRVNGALAWVTQCIVIDGGNNVVREFGVDRVRVIDGHGVETVHPTAADAWLRLALVFAGGAESLAAKATECSRRAAELAAETEVAV